MPYSEQSSIRPEAANYAVRGGGRRSRYVSRAKVVLQVVYSVWSIVCVHFAALLAIFVARAGTFHIVMAPIIIRTPPFPGCVITLSFFLNDATYEVYV